MSTLSDIAKGWYAYIKATPETKARIEARLACCDNCPNKVQVDPVGALLFGVLNDPNNTYKCNLCHCFLGAMAALPEPKCKLNKWP